MSFLIPTIDASVVEYQHGYRQSVTTNGFYFHSAEPEGAIALNGEYLLSSRYGCSNAIAHADTHDSPCTCIQSQTRMIHVYNVTGIVQGIGPFIDQIDILVILKHVTHDFQGIEIVHRLGRRSQLLLHLFRIGLFHGIDAVYPCFATMDVERFHLAKHQVKRRSDVAHYRCFDFTVTVHFLRTDIQLDKLDIRIPFLSLTMVEQPVESGSYQHHHICLTEHQTTGRCSTQRMIIRQYSLGHRHRQERNTRLFHKLLQLSFGLRISSTLTYNN